MPRKARVKGEYGIYHVIMRGNERKPIFESGENKERFLNTLSKIRQKYNCLILAYCLMNNHVHLLVDDNGNDISKIVQSINVSYAMYYNRQNNRIGHLFQDRFRSELIDDNAYLLEVSKYIHNNPVKAGMVKDPAQYPWSSYAVYLGREHKRPDLIDKTLILGVISSRPEAAQREYEKYVTQSDDDRCPIIIDVEEDPMIKGPERYEFISSLENARQRLEEIASARGLLLGDLLDEHGLRNGLMKELRKNSSLTLKEIGALFGGLSESWVSRILGRG